MPLTDKYRLLDSQPYTEKLYVYFIKIELMILIKKVIIIVTLSIICTESLFPSKNIPRVPLGPTNTDKKIISYVLWGAFAFLAATKNGEGIVFKEQIEPTIILKHIAQTYAHCFTVSFFHEFGHALAAYLISQAPLDIHIGGLSHKENPMMKIGPLSIDGLNPLIGFACYYNNKTTTQSQNIIISLAGPLFGILGHFLCKTLEIYTAKSCATEKQKVFQSRFARFSASLKEAITKRTTMDAVALGHLLYMLIPFGSYGDANQVWKEFGVSMDTLNSIGKIGPAITLGACMYYGLHTLRTKRDLKAQD